jgi:hypothetical protein
MQRNDSNETPAVTANAAACFVSAHAIFSSADVTPVAVRIVASSFVTQCTFVSEKQLHILRNILFLVRAAFSHYSISACNEQLVCL